MSNRAPTITVNGQVLTEAQAMTLRCAIESFRMSLEPVDALGVDEHGQRMRTAYLDRTAEISNLMVP